jgi:hypothetical protein
MADDRASDIPAGVDQKDEVLVTLDLVPPYEVAPFVRRSAVAQSGHYRGAAGLVF